MPRAEQTADTRYPLISGFDIVIGGNALEAEARAHVTHVAVDESVDLPGMFTVELVQLNWIGSTASLD